MALFAVYLLEFSDWYIGTRSNDDPNGNWSWSFGFLFFEVVKLS